MRPNAAGLLALLLAVACNTGFAPQYRVEDLRVMAIRATAAGKLAADGSRLADVRLGDTLVLEALFANPLGRAGLAVTWYGCIPPASELLPRCASTELLADPERLAAAAGAPQETGVVDLGTCRPSDPDDDTCAIQVPLPAGEGVAAALAFVVRQPTFRCRPFAEMPVVAVVRADGRSALALKTIRIVPSDAELLAAGLTVDRVLNGNPEIAGVLRSASEGGDCGSGAAVDAATFPAGETVLCALSRRVPQPYTGCFPSPETTTELHDWQWYATGGEFPDEGGVGNATGSEIDFVRPAAAFRLWTILRDGRGGVDWRRYDLDASP